MHTITQMRTSQVDGSKGWLALLCLSVLWTSGCFIKKESAKPPAMGFQVVRPVLPEPSADHAIEPPSLLELEALIVPPPLVISHAAPPRPRVAAQPAPERSAAEKPEEPILAPELTSQELTAAKEETQRNLETVDRNLASTSGRTLNATQKDLVSKVRGFTDSAREAIRGSDWERARGLSKKALVLSEQLVASL